MITMSIKWENLILNKVVKAPQHWSGEMVAEKFGGNAEDWHIIVCGH
jgi:hypothetical protein